ncbi:MAG: hypothetical protein ACKVS9_13280 [Phycisphaerae bacterium]
MRTSHSKFWVACKILASVWFANATATAEIRTWVNPGDGVWGEPTNWSGGVVPGEADTAVIAGNVTVTLRTSHIAV